MDQEGEDITHSYTEPLDNIITRRTILKMGKFFQVRRLLNGWKIPERWKTLSTKTNVARLAIISINDNIRLKGYWGVVTAHQTTTFFFSISYLSQSMVGPISGSSWRGDTIGFQQSYKKEGSAAQLETKQAQYWMSSEKRLLG